MNKLKQVSSFLARVTSDANLSLSHISCCTALCSVWIKDRYDNPFRISRRKIMTAARIKSTSTYHKILKDLTALNYLDYSASYLRVNGSEVLIISLDATANENVFVVR